MIILNPLMDFFARAVMHAKQTKIKELNELEADLMMAGEGLISQKEKGINPETLNYLETKIDDLKNIINNKKKGI